MSPSYRCLAHAWCLTAAVVMLPFATSQPLQAQDTTLVFIQDTTAGPVRAQDTTLAFIQDSTAMRGGSLEMTLGMMNQFMGPMMGRMAEAMMDGILTVLSQPESAERLASFTRNYFEALMRRGFSEEQALRLTAAVGFPIVGGTGGR